MSQPFPQLETYAAAARLAGFPELRANQIHALSRIAKGEDLLIIWPTGSGKSLCYQLPAVVGEGLTVVVSPLIALMEDQTRAAKKRGWAATCIHSGLGKEERQKRLEKVAGGQMKLLYVTPERFRQAEFLAQLGRAKISLLAVDEAHCISQWGPDFRPDYSRLGEIRQTLGNPQTLALTATATQQVQQDVLTQLHIRQPKSAVLWEGVDRPNLSLSVQIVDDFEGKLTKLESWLKSVRGAKIVYFTLIATLEKSLEYLDQRGLGRVFHYHGDLPPHHRQRALKEFLVEPDGVMLATPAFGLGIDKPDVRGVCHFECPNSLESYYQEVGRAGRDGAPAEALWIYWEEDLSTQMKFIESSTPEPSYIRAVYQLLNQWQTRLSSISIDDLRGQLSFKNRKDYRLETALNLLEKWDVISFPQKDLGQLKILRQLSVNELQEGEFSDEIWNTRKKHLQMQLLKLVQWLRSPECRMLGIFRHFSWADDRPCGRCDNCLVQT